MKKQLEEALGENLPTGGAENQLALHHMGRHEVGCRGNENNG
jgi:hypothetical protein